MRRSVEFLAQRVQRRLLQCPPVPPAALMGCERTHAVAIQSKTEAETAQDANCVGAHVDAAADLGQFGGLLINVNLEAGLA